MTTFLENKRKCFVCGAVSTQTELSSSNSFGSPDLDLRPAPMVRYTMDLWVRECPNCRYTAPSLEEPTVVSREWLQSREYLTCGGRAFASELAVRFYRSYMIHRASDKRQAAFRDALHAAWACDDEEDAENAVYCRTKALSEMEAAFSSGEMDASDPNALAQRADLMRRAGRFDDLIREYGGKSFSDDVIAGIIAFQIKKSEERDDRRYCVSDAVPR